MNNTSCSKPLASDNDVTVANAVLTVVTGFLSTLGCVLIMFTHIAYKSLRTKGRTMLFHLSVADLIIVLSHMIGLWNYERFISEPDKIEESSNKDALCVSQGAFTTFGTISSLLWSNAIGLFVLVIVAKNSLNSERMKQLFYIASCIVCWMIPAVIVVTEAALHYFGFHPLGTADCYIIYKAGHNNSVSHLGIKLAELFSYELWAYLTFLILPVVYFVTFCYTRCMIKNRIDFKARATGLELKLLMVPVLFLVLRVWSIILAVMSYWENENTHFECMKISVVLILLNNIGVNGQGFANGILFCVFTRPVRKRLKNTFCQVIQKIFYLFLCTTRPGGTHSNEHEEDILLSTSAYDNEIQEQCYNSTINN